MDIETGLSRKANIAVGFVVLMAAVSAAIATVRFLFF
jgi:hypothetical protein